jgi:hypothetical protein
MLDGVSLANIDGKVFDIRQRRKTSAELTDRAPHTGTIS